MGSAAAPRTAQPTRARDSRRQGPAQKAAIFGGFNAKIRAPVFREDDPTTAIAFHSHLANPPKRAIAPHRRLLRVPRSGSEDSSRRVAVPQRRTKTFSPSGPSPPPDQIAFGSLFTVHCPLSTIHYSPSVSHSAALSQSHLRKKVLLSSVHELKSRRQCSPSRLPACCSRALLSRAGAWHHLAPSGTAGDAFGCHLATF